jgi:iron-sulfur cluster assembly protein
MEGNEVEITESAVQEFKKMILESNAGQNAGIRFFVSSGGCCASYGLDVVENSEPGDELVEKGELKIFIQPEAVECLSTAIIDFTESGENAGFVIKGLPSCCG